MGAALLRQLTATGHRVQSIAWKDVAEWLDHSSKTQEQRIRGAISQIAADNIDILFARGLTDPRQPAERLFMSNTQFPQSVIAATRCMRGCRYVTFGTILERFGGNMVNNAYAASKIALADWVKEQVDRNLADLNLKRKMTPSPNPHALWRSGAGPAHVPRPNGRGPSAASTIRDVDLASNYENIIMWTMSAGSVNRLLSLSSWPLDPILTLSSGQPGSIGSSGARGV